MCAADRKRPSIGEWVAAFVAVGIAFAVSEFLGISQRWETAVAFTVLLFSGVLIGTRPVWGRGAFWPDLIAVFLLHCVILGGIERSLPAESAGPRGIPMMAAIMVEGVFIIVVLFKRSMPSDSDPD
jgi:hypothetical protein